jgi:hypothetical protein
MWYVIMNQDHRYLEPRSSVYRDVSVSRVNILIPSPHTPLEVCRTVSEVPPPVRSSMMYKYKYVLNNI